MAVGTALSVSGCMLSSPSPFPFRTTRLFSFPGSKDPAAFASVTIRNSGVSADPQEDNYPHQPSLQTNGSSASNAATQTYTNTSPNSRRKYGWESDPVSDDGGGLSLKDYFQQSKQMLRSDGGPPRWFSPLECASRSQQSPLLLFLPGIDGVGLGLLPHHKKLGEIFDVWCLHIPLTDRTSFTDLVKLVEETVRSEYCNAPKRPIYLIGESFGACIALAVAARNPDIDLVLILANPGTPLRMVLATLGKGLPLQQTVEELSQNAVALSSYVSVLADVLPVETLIWRLKMLKSAAAFVNSRLHAVKAQTLIISSGRDEFLPSQEEGERLSRVLPNCDIRQLSDSGHSIFLEDGNDLVAIIKKAGIYKRGKHRDCVSDYLRPKPAEFQKTYEPYRWTEVAVNPVMLSTLGDGKIVQGLAGIPSEGPVLVVGYHMLLGIELIPLVSRFWLEKEIVLRGIGHPLMFSRSREGLLPELSSYDPFRFMGAVPVSASNFFKLLSSNSHVLLYPGGMREALHRKGEEYQLFWPEQSEFVRMAARFGAKIVPFGVVGEDDVSELLLDYDDLMKIPFSKDAIQKLTDETVKLRSEMEGEVGNQDVHSPIILPKLPGRFYYYFGKPIETQGRKEELKSREKAQEVYMEVKSEVNKCIAYLKEKREKDPYRSLLARLLYQATHGFNSQVPTFQL
ncbi:PREDICTED: acyltransferase-like protein At3g26840, chloroplastic isoform X2 [Ipomoea nil]|uniref:acyltransferase-like protein At3g26840, chloroplastic isoform X2 n=1 Tax=Ipomoea nil TaxID=35883 RepID=UPI00090188FE|nr:PREDICTED: acyltransferase-like protein At3g26840, chloroplastic isoform X2 [Ipomoea nil]